MSTVEIHPKFIEKIFSKIFNKLQVEYLIISYIKYFEYLWLFCLVTSVEGFYGLQSMDDYR